MKSIAIRTKIAIPEAQEKEILARKLKVNGVVCSMKNFLFNNLCDKDVEPITKGEAKDVIAMSIGDEMYIGHSIITRIK